MVSTRHIPPGKGKSVWIANNKFVTFKATGKDTGGYNSNIPGVGKGCLNVA